MAGTDLEKGHHLAMGGLLGGLGGSDCFRRLDAVTLSDAEQRHAKGAARLLGVAGGKIRDRGLATARLFGDLALGDALGGKCGDVVFPLHEPKYIGFPIF